MLLDSTSVRAFLGLPTGDDLRLTIAMGYAERAAARYCGREQFESRWYVRTFRVQESRSAVIAPVRPLVAVPAVCLDDRGFALVAADVTTGTPGIFTFTGHELTVGDGPFRVVNNGGLLPVPLDSGVDYWVAVVDGDDFQLTDTEGSTTGISITDAGTGMHRLVGACEPRSEIRFEAPSGIITRAGGGRVLFPEDWPVTVVYRAGVCEDGNDCPDDLFGALVEQAAYRFVQGGPAGRLGAVSQEKPGGARGTYTTSEWAPGVLAVLDRWKLTSIG